MMSLLWHHSHNLKTFRGFFSEFRKVLLRPNAFGRTLAAAQDESGRNFHFVRQKFSLPSQDCVWAMFLFFSFSPFRFDSPLCLLFLLTFGGFLQSHLHTSSPHHPSKSPRHLFINLKSCDIN